MQHVVSQVQFLHVFENAGLETKYLTTNMMRTLSKQKLIKRYNWVDLGASHSRAMSGDIAVYPGHVVLITKVYSETGKADIIHVTSGRDLKNPGEAVQSERSVKLSDFRGPLQRILRHKDIYSEVRGKGRFWRVEPVVKKD